MNYNKAYRIPNAYQRIMSVWYRHVKVYISSFFSNALPPFIEPLVFLAGISIGLGAYIQQMGNMSYPLFLASGLIVTSAMYTAAFECTFGTFIRLEHEMVYDGILGAPISAEDIVIGEIFFSGTKGIFFSFAVLVVIWLVGIVNYPLSILTILVGFITGVMFSALSLLITSFVRNINHFNFYISGLLSPMFFFSGVVFPLENLPKGLQIIAELIPLTHVVRMARSFCVPNNLNLYFLYDFAYCILFIMIVGSFAIKNLKRRMIV